MKIRNDLWSDAWVGRYESVYSLIWKYAHVNLLESSTLIWRFGACLHSGGVEPGRGGHTLPFQDELMHRDPLRRFAAGKDVLLAGPSIRICGKCVDHGYVSVFHQVAFTDKCAIHDRKLISDCPKCHTRFPAPGQFVSWTQSPFHCPWCSHFLGTEVFRPRRLFAQASIFAHEGRYDEMDLWLRRLCDRHSAAMHSICRNGVRVEPPPESIKRELLGAVMQAIEPVVLSPSVLGAKGPHVTSVAFQDEPVLPDRDREQVRDDERERIRIYRAIRRQLRRRIARQPGMGGHKRALRKARQHDPKRLPKSIAQFVQWRLTVESVTDGDWDNKDSRFTDFRLITMSSHVAPLQTRPGYRAPMAVWARFVLGVFPGLKRHRGGTAAYPRENTAIPLARRLSVLPNGAGGWHLIHYWDPAFWRTGAVANS